MSISVYVGRARHDRQEVVNPCLQVEGKGCEVEENEHNNHTMAMSRSRCICV